MACRPVYRVRNLMTDRTVLAALAAAALFLSNSSTAAPADTRSADDARAVRLTFEAHNREREAAELGPLTLDPMLTAAAQGHADDMAGHGKMTHDGSDGSTPSDRIKRQDYPFQSDGENVAEGYRTVDELMRGWMESEHHRENILGKFSQVGIAVVTDDEDGNPTGAPTSRPLAPSSTRPRRPTTWSRPSTRSGPTRIFPRSRPGQSSPPPPSGSSRRTPAPTRSTPKEPGDDLVDDPQTPRVPLPQGRRVGGHGPARGRARS